MDAKPFRKGENTMYQIKLTDLEYKRICNLIACNIDANITPQLQEAARRGDKQKTDQLLSIKQSDQELLNTLLKARSTVTQ